MRRHTLLTIILTLITAGTLHAGTFDRSPIAPELGLDVLNRTVARDQIGRDLFSDPYATVTIGTVDVYDVFPYVEARNFEVVSDPQWNRLVFGEAGRNLGAYTGASSALGALSNPRGMAVDEFNHVYVADAGNNRIVVLQATSEFGDMQLVPLYAIGGLHGPYDVAFSDGGTPFDAGDDMLYVADTGRNRVVAFVLDDGRAREVASLGDLGSGAGRFAGPLAITVGRRNGANTPDVFVADAHNRRIVHLRHDATGLQWVDAQNDGADVLTSLDTDQWGNLYAAAPNMGIVRKFGPDLAPVADLEAGIVRPRSFHVPFLNINDHRTGKTVRAGQPNGMLVEQWSAASGMRLWNLGVEISDLAVDGADAPVASFAVTDRSQLTLEVLDAASGRSLGRHPVGTMDAGVHSLPLGAEELQGASGDLILRLSAASSYTGGPSVVAQTAFHANGSGTNTAPLQAALLGNTPNPSFSLTRISFLLPSADAAGASLRVFDAMGRMVRTFDHRFSPGLNEVVWDGTDDMGHSVKAGVYFYRLDAGPKSFNRKMVFVH